MRLKLKHCERTTCGALKFSSFFDQFLTHQFIDKIGDAFFVQCGLFRNLGTGDRRFFSDNVKYFSAVYLLDQRVILQ